MKDACTGRVNGLVTEMDEQKKGCLKDTLASEAEKMRGMDVYSLRLPLFMERILCRWLLFR